MLEPTYDRVYCLGRRDRPDPTIDIMDELGATYVDSRQTPVDAVGEAYEPMDFVFEATGYAPHVVQAVQTVAPNGVLTLLGVPGPADYEFDVGAMHSEMVLHNKAMIGSVNSNVGHFEAATDTLDALPEWLIDDLVTGIYPVDGFERAFEDDNTVIKTAVEFSPYEER
jgi:threonine dehydrogenase-like Zn-dependent dehydrogenase